MKSVVEEWLFGEGGLYPELPGLASAGALDGLDISLNVSSRPSLDLGNILLESL
jgi:hypothetical protein